MPDVNNHDLLEISPIIEQTDNPLHELQQEIANMPDIDPDKVRIALERLRAGGIDILGGDTEKMEAAIRIARRILEESGDSVV